MPGEVSVGDGLPSVRQRINLSLYNVMTTRYSSIRLIDQRWPHWIVSHVRKGIVTTTTRNVTSVASAGDVMIHPPGIPFSECSDGPGVHEWLMLSAHIMDNVELFRLHPVTTIVTLREPEDFSRTFAVLMKVWMDTVLWMRELSLTAYTCQLLWMLLNDWQASGSISRPEELCTVQDRFTTVIAYMSKYADQRLTLAMLADVVHLHPNYFHRMFKKTYGITPFEMLRNIRMERARFLLESTDDSIGNIVASCGQSETIYFSRMFREKFGKTPSEYRREARALAEGYIPSPRPTASS